MVDHTALRADSARLLGAEVLAAGLFVIDIGRLGPTAAGVAGAAGAEAVSSVLVDSALVDGLASGAGYVAGRHAAYRGAADREGVTPVMVLAVTAGEVALMDWSGNVRSGTGPTKVFARFSRSAASITSRRSGPTRHIELTQDGVQARVQCTLGLLAPGKREMREVLALLGAD